MGRRNGDETTFTGEDEMISQPRVIGYEIAAGNDADMIEDELAEIEERGYVVLHDVLSPQTIEAMRAALAEHLNPAHFGRNDFEGHLTERVYSLVAIDPVFTDLVEHPRILALCDALLEPNYLLTASQAIRIHPGETPQAFHTDDAFYRLPRPRKAVSISTIFAIDEFTTENGATQVLPGSHNWPDPDKQVLSILSDIDFATKGRGSNPNEVPDRIAKAYADQIVDVTMPAGSVVVFLGTLLHRGGRNRSAASRLALSNQYCEPWARPQENYFLAIPREKAASFSPRVQSLLGYSIHPPFMGHALGKHPLRFLTDK